MSKGKVDRRGFIKGAAAAGAGLALGGLLHARRSSADLCAQDPAAVDRAIRDHREGSISDVHAQATVEAFMTGDPGGPKVVHVHDTDATFWDFGDDYYGDFVDQEIVDAMVDRGVMELTGASSAAQAWQALIPAYAPGKAVAIKVNFNNGGFAGCDYSKSDIDALIHPVNAIAHGLHQAYPNFDNADLWIYDGSDATPRMIPERFKSGCLYSGLRFFDGGCNELATYDSTDASADITWRNPDGVPTPPSRQVTDVLLSADYLINIPILKRHGGTGVTFAFKNHFGSISNCSPLHDWTYKGYPYYAGTSYNPMVDVYRNDHILGKTVLTIGDALFGNWESNAGKPSPWATFGNDAPNSLLFSTDPVAMDCVLCDLLEAETSIYGMSDDYLVYAESCGLGTYERGEPWGGGYSQITYLKVELQG